MKKKIIYVPMGADILHTGHLNIIKKSLKNNRIVKENDPKSVGKHPKVQGKHF